MSVLQRLEAALRAAEDETGVDLPEQRYVIALSGGPDSLALLHAFTQIVPADRLVAAHLDHQLRPTSAAEAQRVAALAGEWAIPFQQRAVDVASLAAAEGASVETAGRAARYRFLAEVARESGAQFIATGHNADDQAETVLMHLLRGSGLSGLRGMRPLGPLPNDAGLWLLRPMLTTTRTEIEVYGNAHKLEPLIDESNADMAYFRNRIRNELLPTLEAYSPRIRWRLRELAELAAGDYAVIEMLANQIWPEIVDRESSDELLIDRPAWLALPLGLRRMAMRRAVELLRPDLRDIGLQTIDAAVSVATEGQTGSQAFMPGDLVLTVSYDTLHFAAAGSTGVDQVPQLPGGAPLELVIPGEIVLADGWRLAAERVEPMSIAQVHGNPDPWTAYVDVGDLAAVQVRAREPGERVQPLGLGGHSASVKDIMIDRKIPAAARAHWPLVVAEEQFVWLPGYLIDHRVRVTETTQTILRLRCLRRPGGSHAG